MNDESKLNRMNENPMRVFTNVVSICCTIGLFAFGGGCSRYDKEDAALRSLIEQNRRTQDEKISHISDRMRELSDRVRGLNERLENLSRDFKIVSRQITDIETSRRQNNEMMTDQNERLEKTYASLLERFESLSQQVAGKSSSERQSEQGNPSVRFPKQPQTVAQSESAAPGNPLEKTTDDLQQKFKRNSEEINELRKKNPACYLTPKMTFINRENKIATMKDRRYCICANVTFVRDAFYCSACKHVTPYRGNRDPYGENRDDYYGYGYCKVCRQMSFYRWLEARKKVDETATLNARIDELYTENESLEKEIRSMKKSRLRR